MSGLLWPGDERAGGVLDEAAVLRAMVAVEDAWLAALVAAGVAPAGAAADLTTVVGGDDLPLLAADAESGGNPVIGLVRLLRERVGDASGGGPEAARWLHRGLTSQDVVDTALAIAVRDGLVVVEARLRDQLAALAALARRHAATPMVARTLTQHAVPTTFGAKVAAWTVGVLAAARRTTAAREGLAVQLGGAAGTWAAAVELAGDVATAEGLVDDVARRLGLPAARPWHTSRGRFTAVGDALVACTDAWGHLANDVLTLGRPEIGEVREVGAPGSGGSSTMPQKTNPVLSVLLRRAALSAPPLGATLHLAAAGAVDERSDGAWHAEWETLRLLGRRTVVAAGQAADLLAGLHVDAAAMTANLAAAEGVDGEQRAMAELAGRDAADPSDRDYLGLASRYVAAVVAEVEAHLEES